MPRLILINLVSIVTYKITKYKTWASLRYGQKWKESSVFGSAGNSEHRINRHGTEGRRLPVDNCRNIDSHRKESVQ